MGPHTLTGIRLWSLQSQSVRSRSAMEAEQKRIIHVDMSHTMKPVQQLVGFGSLFHSAHNRHLPWTPGAVPEPVPLISCPL